MTEQEIELIKRYATENDMLDKFIYLREDDNGRYIEYAFKEGVPHDNRCLDRYSKPHSRHGFKHVDLWEINKIYYLLEACCGLQNVVGVEHCSAGHPCKDCIKFWDADWTYDEPGSHACWTLCKVNMDDIKKAYNIKNEYE